MNVRRIATRNDAAAFAAGPPRQMQAYLAGIPFLLAAATPWLAFHPAAVLAGFVLAVLAFFTVQLPVAAALLGLPASDAAEFTLSPRVYMALLSVWTATAWIAAAASA